MSSQVENRPPRRRASRLPYVIALFLLGLLIVAPWLMRGRFQPVATGTPAPDFVVTNLDGDPVRFSDYRGKVVLVNVWATWCAPCRQEMPSMERLYSRVRMHPRGGDFEILAVSIDGTKETPNPLYPGVTRAELEAFAAELGLTFPIVRDPAGDIEDIYQTTAVPESFLVGRDGIIYRKVAGQIEWDAAPNVELVESLLEREWSGAQTR